jgi:hypothetical protein
VSEDNDIVQKLTSAEVYVNYVIEFIDEYKRQVKLVDKHDMILPSYLNRAIAEYGSHSATLVSEEARLRGYLKEVKRDFDKWNSRTFMEVRTRLNNESTSKKQIAVKEIEMAVKTYHADKYYEFTEAMENTELKIDYIHNLASFWKKQDNMLSNLSYNMRSELKSLSVQSRANGETEQSKRRKLKD